MKPLFLYKYKAMVLGLTVLVSTGCSQSFSGLHSFFGVAQAQTTAPVGTTAGSFQVGGNGGANYTILIEVPPGRSGIQPQLSLQYNSQQTNGLLGMGWSLTGLSAIARCPKTIAQDGAVGGINFSSRDRFCLDGQRLVAVRGAYGANGTEYSTERESWMKMVSHGSAGSGPAYFTAVAKDGSQIEFGNTVDSRIEATGTSEVRVWSVNQVTDRNGNYLTVAYTDDQTNGEYYPVTIQYTGNTNGYAPQRRVEFEYEDRTDASISYVAGSIMKRTKRLTTVRTKVGTPLVTVKEYRLAYEYGQATKRSRMASVQECGGDSVCLPATVFGWQDNNRLGTWEEGEVYPTGHSGGDWVPMDVNGDGLTDIVNLDNSSGIEEFVAFISKGDGTWEEGEVYPTGRSGGDWVPMDVNGDGLTDIVNLVVNPSGTEEFVAFISKGDGTWGEGEVYPTGRSGGDWVPMDVNGDGLTDIVNLVVNPSGTEEFVAFISKGDGTWGEGEVYPTGRSGGDWVPMDVNGDGLTDIVNLVVNPSGTEEFVAFISKGDGTWEGKPVYFPERNLDGDWIPMDVNGDGLTDIVNLDNSSGREKFVAFISKGDGTWEKAPVYSTERNSDGDWVPMDVNGDGLLDIVNLVVSSSGGEEFVAFVSQGDGTWEEKNSFYEAASGDWVPMDMNGDGLTDIVNLDNSSGREEFVAYLAPSPYPDILDVVTNGLKAQILIQYKPLTDNSIYTKGSGAVFPVVDAQAPLYVVSRHSIKESASSQTPFIYDHQYEVARTNLYRRWQGFEKTILIDQQNATKTTTMHYMDFPLTGMIQNRTITDQTNGSILGITSWNYQSTKEANNVYKTWLDNSETEHYTEGTHNYTLGSAYTYDGDYRNITQVLHQGDKSGTQEEDDFYTCTQYQSGTGDNWWQASFPQAIKRVKTACGSVNWNNTWDLTNDLTWQQYGYSSDDRMNLTTEQVWDDSKGKFIQTFTAYDIYGNITSVTDAMDNRSTITYDSTYQTFPVTRTTPQTENALTGLTVTTEFEPKFGIKTKIIDGNDIISMQILDDGIDGMGRVVKVNGPGPDGTLVTLWITQFSLGVDSIGMVITTRNRTAWAGEDTPDDGTWLESKEYIDGLGRPTKTTSNGYASGISLVSGEVEFNSKGQVENSYLPYYINTSGNCVQAVPNGSCVETQFSTHEYDIHGRLTRTTTPNGAVEEVTYSLHDDRQVITKNPDPTQLSDSNLVDWTEHYTSRGHVDRRIAPDGTTEQYEYDVLGRVTSVTGPLEQISTTIYNSLGKVTRETHVELGTTTYSYNDNGNLIERIDGKDQKITFAYDDLGRITSKEVYNNTDDPGPAKTVTYTYDEASKDYSKGRLTTVDSPESIEEFSYDATGVVKEKKILLDIDGDGTIGIDGNAEETLISGFTHDAAGRIDQITYPDGSLAHYAYRETDGSLQSIEMQESGQSASTYASYEPPSALGALTQVRYGNDSGAGVLSTYSYDDVGRLTGSATSRAPPDSSTLLDFSYSWNLANKLLEITDNAGKGLGQTFKTSTNSSYDNRGRLLKAQGFYGTRDYAYDATGNLTMQGSSWYLHSSSKKNQLQTVCSASPGTGNTCPTGQTQETVTYDANGNVLQRIGGSVTTEYIYDAENRIIEIRKNNLMVNRFTYGSEGNRISKTDYDSGGNKTLASFYPLGLYEIVKKTDGTGVHTKYLNGPQGVVSAISKNQGASLNNWLAWNTGTLLASMSNPAGSMGGLGQYLKGKVAQVSFYPFAGEALKACLGFGYLGLVITGIPYLFIRSAARIRRRVVRGLRRTGVIEKPTAESWQGLCAGSDRKPGRLWMTFVALLIFTGGTVVAPSLGFAAMTSGANGAGVPEAGNILFFHHDHLGSDILVTDENGNEMSWVAYEPYGQMDQTKSTGTDNFRPKFTGKEWDTGSSLYYFGARYYDPELGRFLAPDPAGQFHSPYMYGSGDPLSGVDPDGRFFIELAIILVGVILGAYIGGATVNHSMNPAGWDWKSGKTWAGIAGGAVIGGLTAGAGLGAAAGIGVGVAAAGLSGGLATVATTGGTALAVGAIAGTANVAFSAMGGAATGADLGKAFGMGFAMGFVMVIPVVGEVALAGMGGYDTYQFVKDPSVGNGIALGIDVLFISMATGARFGRTRARGCASFAENTKVSTEEGRKDIEEIKVGDEVLSYDEKTGETKLNPVSKLFTRIAAGVIAVTLGTATVEATPEHPFYVPDEGWVQAKDLDVGSQVLQLDGSLAEVTALQARDGDVRVYNFEVADAHNYFVSDEEVLVHNPDCLVSNRFKKAHGASTKKAAKKQAQSRVDRGDTVGTDKNGKRFNTSVDTKNLAHGARDAINPANPVRGAGEPNFQYRTKYKAKGYNTKIDKRGRAKKPREFDNKRVFVDKKNGQIYHFDGVER